MTVHTRCTNKQCKADISYIVHGICCYGSKYIHVMYYTSFKALDTFLLPTIQQQKTGSSAVGRRVIRHLRWCWSLKRKKKCLLNTEHCIHSGVAINITVLNRTQPFLTLTKREHTSATDNYGIILWKGAQRWGLWGLRVAARAQRSSMALFSLRSRFQFTRPGVDRAMGVGAWESSRCIGRCTPILIPTR